MKSLRELVRKGLIMADKRKLQRIPMGKKYTTGDAQDWTYEYTREDFDAALTAWPTVTIGSRESKLRASIIKYFRDNPEIAAKNNIKPIELDTLMRVCE